MKKLSNTEAELKKSVAYEKEACNLFFISIALTGMLKYQFRKLEIDQKNFSKKIRKSRRPKKIILTVGRLFNQYGQN